MDDSVTPLDPSASAVLTFDMPVWRARSIDALDEIELWQTAADAPGAVKTLRKRDRGVVDKLTSLHSTSSVVQALVARNDSIQ
jgi:hypothetical protein